MIEDFLGGSATVLVGSSWVVDLQLVVLLDVSVHARCGERCTLQRRVAERVFLLIVIGVSLLGRSLRSCGLSIGM